MDGPSGSTSERDIRRRLSAAARIPQGEWQAHQAPQPWVETARRWRPATPVGMSDGAGWWLSFDTPTARTWFGPRLGWLSAPLPCQPFAGIASSHLGRDVRPHSGWLSRLRQAVALGHDRFVWLIVHGTTCAELTRAAAERLGAPLLVIEYPRKTSGRDPWSHWSRTIDRYHVTPPRQPHLSISPPLAAAAEEPAPSSLPLADRILFGLADTLILLHARSASRTRRALDQRRRETPSARRTIVLPRPLPRRAVRWDVPRRRRRDPVLLRRLPWPALLHWTRRAAGPWPGQPADDYFSRLLLLSEESDRSPLAALCKILREARLRASPWGIPGRVPVVCFSEQPLEEWAALRRYRKHRQRWDFEPYGVAIRREALQRRGARAVRYGKPNRSGAARVERSSPWRQPAMTSSGSIDWRVEREWRIVGDVCLRPLFSTDLVVFVPDEAAADRVAGAVSCSIVVLDHCCRGAAGL